MSELERRERAIAYLEATSPSSTSIDTWASRLTDFARAEVERIRVTKSDLDNLREMNEDLQRLCRETSEEARRRGFEKGIEMINGMCMDELQRLEPSKQNERVRLCLMHIAAKARALLDDSKEDE